MQEHILSRKKLGTNIEINVVSDDPKTYERMEVVYDFFTGFEQEFSRFLPHSVLSLLNTYKRWKVSSRFLDLIKKSREVSRATEGLFNPLADISTKGYSKDFESGEFVQTERKVDLDLEGIHIQGNEVILGQNQNFDFGGIGKGYAVDLASDLLRIFGYDNFFINAGGDIYASGRNLEGNPWIIGIESPFDGSLFGVVNISDVAIATSGSYKRNWNIGDAKFHHILNPRENENNFEIVSVSLITDRCYRADSFTKAIFNMKPEQSLAFMESNGLDGVIIDSGGNVYSSISMEKKFGFYLVNK